MAKGREVALVAFALVSCYYLAHAWTTYNLRVIYVIRERIGTVYLYNKFYNYDFCSQSVPDTNVDWPVGLIFWDNADVAKVKAIYLATHPGGTPTPCTRTLMMEAAFGSG